MRSIVSVGTSIAVILVGVMAIQQSIDENSVSNPSSNTQNATTVAEETFGGIALGAGEMVIWGGVAAVVLISLGVLVNLSRGGR